DGVVKFVQAGSGYISQHTKTLHFGLDDRSEASRVEVLWPSGAKQQFDKLLAGSLYQITEGSQEIKQIAFAKRNFSRRAADFAFDNESRSHDLWFIDPVPLPDQRRGPALLYLGRGERPSLSSNVEVVNLETEAPEVAAGYAIFRKYLLD